MDYYLPTRLVSGEGAVRRSGGLIAAFGKRCLIVTGGSAAKRCGALGDITAVLTEKGIEYSIFDSVKPNPDIESCVRGGRLAHEFGAEFIIGVGGGSPMDASKVIALSAANPELDSVGLYSMNWPNAPLPIVLVGTTAGTGSELTPVAVITNTDGRKKSFRAESLYASLSIGDARYTASMPLSVTASTGVDALCHCVESYFSKKANDISRAFAMRGVSLLLSPLSNVAAGNLPTAREREDLYNASLLGGMAISVTGTIMPHNLGYFLTENYGVPHGFACAQFLPTLLEHAWSCDNDRCDALFSSCGTNLQELKSLVLSLTPKLDVHLSAGEIETLLPRWENNNAIKNTIGNVDTAQIRDILTGMFG